VGRDDKRRDQVQVLDGLKEMIVQDQTQAKQLTDTFQALIGDFEEAHKC
jgi:uncharacterized coiled-coil protein SlyX